MIATKRRARGGTSSGRDAGSGAVLDGEVLWSAVHDDIKAETSRSEFIDCVYARFDRAGPASTLPESDEYEPGLLNVAMHGAPIGLGGEGDIVVGTVPKDPCLVRAEAVRERLQTTGTISIGRAQGQRPDFIDYRVLAVVWDGGPEDASLVGGAFWKARQLSAEPVEDAKHEHQDAGASSLVSTQDGVSGTHSVRAIAPLS